MAELQPETIVVGVDSSPESTRAVLWALGLAGHTHQPVHMVHAQPTAPEHAADPAHRRRWAQAGQAIVDEAVEMGRQANGVTVTGESVDASVPGAAQALVVASRRAAMLVLGARGHGTYTGMLIGSVSQHASRHALCPVVTVRAQCDVTARRVVLGIDDAPATEDATGLAFQLAADLRADLTAIHAWRAPALHGAGVHLPMPPDTGNRQRHLEQGLAEQLGPWMLKFPTVRVTPEVIPGHAAGVLTDASEHAAVVVVGCRDKPGVTGRLMGSVSQAVLHHAHCPVAVAH